jgi:hypothetical protein
LFRPNWRRFAPLLFVCTSACLIMRDVEVYTLDNPTTGKKIECRTGLIEWDDEEQVQRYRHQIEECLHACERYGFRWIGETRGAKLYGRPYVREPRAPDVDMRAFIPGECLP